MTSQTPVGGHDSEGWSSLGPREREVSADPPTGSTVTSPRLSREDAIKAAREGVRVAMSGEGL